MEHCGSIRCSPSENMASPSTRVDRPALEASECREKFRRCGHLLEEGGGSSVCSLRLLHEEVASGLSHKHLREVLGPEKRAAGETHLQTHCRHTGSKCCAEDDWRDLGHGEGRRLIEGNLWGTETCARGCRGEGMGRYVKLLVPR